MKASRSSRRRGFTLIEVLLVLLILVILGGLAITAYGPIMNQARIRGAKSQVGLFKTALGAYQLDVGAYPDTQEGLEALITNPGFDRWHGPYMETTTLPVDPWSMPFQYQYPGTHNPMSYDLWSMGPDGVNGTDDDVGNWEMTP